MANRGLSIRYNDAYSLLDTALMHENGISYDAGDYGTAKKLVQRCNQLRVELRKTGGCPYDHFTISPPRQGDSVITIQPRPQIDMDKVRPLDLETE